MCMGSKQRLQKIDIGKIPVMSSTVRTMDTARTCRQYGEMYTSRTFLYFSEGDFLGSSTEKILNNFKRLMA